VYDTRLLLSGEIPRIAAHYESRQTAEQVLRKLKDLGINAIAVTDSMLRLPQQSFHAYTLTPGKQEVLFKDRSGAEKKTVSDDVFLIITGTIQTSTVSETVTTRKKLNVTTTLLTGGIPVYKNVKEKTTASSQETESFIRLYNNRPVDPYVVISQHDLDYSFLGEKTAVSARANFTSVISALREIFPQAIFNDVLSKPFRITSTPGKVREDMELYCRLIYLFNLAKSRQCPAAW
jgi:hypothetical protein